MEKTLWLTGEEKKTFDALPAALKEGWDVQEETGTVYESDDVLRVRSNIARLSKYPPVEKLIEKLKTAKTLEDVSLDAVPEDILPTFFFTIGARGISVLMKALLQHMNDDEDVEGLGAMSKLRHDVLETNASINYV